MTRRHTTPEVKEAVRLALAAYPMETYASLARKLDVDDGTVRRIAVEHGLEGFRGFANTEARQEVRSLVPGGGGTLPTGRREDGVPVPDGQGQLDFGDGE